MIQKSTLILILCFLICTFAFGDEKGQNAIVAPLNTVANDIATQYHQMGWFSGSLLLMKGEQEIVASSYGFQNIDEQIKNTSQTRFNLGSIIKDFTKCSGQLQPDTFYATFNISFRFTTGLT